MRRLIAVLVAAVLLSAGAPAAAAPPDPATSTPIKHVVMLMQDNHSFDNYFGTYPGADGIPSGACQPVRLGGAGASPCVQPFHLGSSPAEDLSHGLGVQRRQYNDGAMNGFVAAFRRLGQDGSSTMGYYDGQDIPYYWNVANRYVLFDRFFSSTRVGNRESYLYWLAGRAPASSKPLTDSAGYDALPTVFDRLAAKNITAKFYVENLDRRSTTAQGLALAPSSVRIKVPLLSMRRFQDGGPMAGRVVDLSEYYSDLRSGTLPAVSYIVTSRSSENPPARLTAGQATVRKLTTELVRSRYWSSSAFMWTYDGWGGWYDHVPPPQIDPQGYGFRVPALLVSPYARQGVVDHTVLDYTSMLAFVERNWGLEPLAARDAGSAGLASAFDFSLAPRAPEILPATRAQAEPAAASSPAPVIYSTYGSALALVSLVVALAVFWRRSVADFMDGVLRPWQASAARRRRLEAALRRFGAIPAADHWPGSPAPAVLAADGWAIWAASRQAQPSAPHRPVLARAAAPLAVTIDPDPRGLVSDWESWYASVHGAPTGRSRSGAVGAWLALRGGWRR
jgi:phospholipase C